MIRHGVKDEAVQVEYDDEVWTLMLRKKLAKPVGGQWNQLVYIDAYHMESDKHYGTFLFNPPPPQRHSVPGCLSLMRSHG